MYGSPLFYVVPCVKPCTESVGASEKWLGVLPLKPGFHELELVGLAVLPVGLSAYHQGLPIALRDDTLASMVKQVLEREVVQLEAIFPTSQRDFSRRKFNLVVLEERVGDVYCSILPLGRCLTRYPRRALRIEVTGLRAMHGKQEGRPC